VDAICAHARSLGHDVEAELIEGRRLAAQS
jgi:hypothetical protein